MFPVRIDAVWLLFFITPGIAAAQTVEGTVRDASIGNGIAGVQVELTRNSTVFYQTVSDAIGGFRMEGLGPGEYALRYTSPDYVPSGSIPLVMSAGQALKLESRLLAWSGITGRVLDAEGRPAPGARVELRSNGVVLDGQSYQRTSWGDAGGGLLSDSPRQLVSRGQADGSGNFAVRVTPGRYRISVFPPERAASPPPARKSNGSRLAWGLSEPQLVSVPPLSGINGVELRLPIVPAFAVRGRIRKADGTPAAGALVLAEVESYQLQTQARPDGSFEFPSVPPGDWRLSAESSNGRALQRITVGGQDLDGVVLYLAEPLTLQVQVKVEGTRTSEYPRFGPVVLTPVDGFGQGAPSETPVRDTIVISELQGRYIASGGYPGRYRFSSTLQGGKGGYYLSAVIAGDADLLQRDAEIVSGQVLTLVYRKDSGVVRGKIDGCAAGAVLLMPSDPAQRGRGRSRVGMCNPNGTYAVSGVPPGGYLAVALAGNSAIPNEAVVALHGTSVTVGTGEQVALDLRCTLLP